MRQQCNLWFYKLFRTAIVNVDINYGKLNTIGFGKLEFNGQLMRYAHATRTSIS
ncbi:MAG: hypothetical protein F6K55_02365 [Moorea sp. SIO4A3]|nr:hypothetical protein [Moorena sp. SIO4A3]